MQGSHRQRPVLNTDGRGWSARRSRSKSAGVRNAWALLSLARPTKCEMRHGSVESTGHTMLDDGRTHLP